MHQVVKMGFNKRFLVPDLLQKQSTYSGDWSENLAFQYHYNVLPTSIISRFIVKMNLFVFQNNYWRYGVVLQSRDGQNKALVQADIEEKKIYISVKGRKLSRRRFLEIIRADFLRINDSIPGIKFKETVPVPGNPDVTVSYEHLLRLEGKGHETYWPEGLDDEINVKELLNGIEPEKKRISVRQAEKAGIEFDRKNEPPDYISEPLFILHLSDLYIEKDTDPETILQPLVADLKDDEEGPGINRLDYLIVSGDLTKSAEPDEYEKALQFISKLIQQFKITKQECIIVPGNHDLSWNADVYKTETKRNIDITKLDDGDYKQEGDVYLVQNKKQYPKRFENFSKYFFLPFMGKEYPLEFENQCLTYLYEETRIQFITLNSSWEIDEFYPNRSGIHPSALARGLANADDEQRKSVDAGRLDKNDFILRIGVLHHPVTGNEKIQNDAFLEQLRKAGVRICMHGHVHENCADLIYYPHPRKIHATGAGSFGVPSNNRPESTPRSYNLLEITPDYSSIKVHTRCLKKDTGAWTGLAIWKGPEPNIQLTYYTIEL